MSEGPAGTYLSTAELTWARSYNAYQRLAGTPEHLGNLLDGPRTTYRTTGHVPTWCGVDLLRGWAFWLMRRDYFAGGATLDDEWHDVIRALRAHPGAEPADLPPEPAGPTHSG